MKHWLHLRDDRMEECEALLRKQIRHAIRCENYITASLTGRQLLKRQVLDWRAVGFWIRAEIAAMAGKGNKGGPLVERALAAVKDEKGKSGSGV